MITVYRKEIKYILPIEAFYKLQKPLEQIMETDIHSKMGSYMVRSQYYDSMTDADLQDNLDGVMEKRKLRLRIYSLKDEKVKLEYKCKSGTDGVKHSLLLTREEAMQMEQHRYAFLMEKKEELAKKLYLKMTQQIYRPKTIIEYQRKAYAFAASNVRITFDTKLQGSANPYGLFEKEPFYVPFMEADRGVLEVKYNDFLPDLFKPILAQMDESARANSKYLQARGICI